jgi:hypothetical protein
MIREMKLEIYSKKVQAEAEVKAAKRVARKAKEEKGEVLSDSDLSSLESDKEKPQEESKGKLEGAKEAKPKKSPEEQLQETVKNTEITQDAYEEKLSELQGVYWDLSMNYPDFYDFGILELDFRPFKTQIC